MVKNGEPKKVQSYFSAPFVDQKASICSVEREHLKTKALHPHQTLFSHWNLITALHDLPRTVREISFRLQYANAWKLDAIAAALGKGSNLALVDLAVEFGFNDMKHFRELFSRRFGISPAAYRKNPPTAR